MSVSHPILMDIPDHFESERLLIRAPRPGDGPAINEAAVESYEALREWMAWSLKPQTLEESEAFARRATADFVARRELPLLLFRKDSGQFVGGSGLHSIEWEIPAFEIGYWVRTSLQGQGYITEAVNRITEFAFESLNARRVCIQCDASNTRSAAVARRAGFEQEAHLRNDGRNNTGVLNDTLIFAKIRPD